MLLKERKLATELQVLRALQGRVSFSPEMNRQLWNSDAGQTGENAFDQIGDNYEDFLVRLNDLVLSIDGKLCQVDAVYICGDVLYLFEIKNWSGVFRLENGEFLGGSACPLAQLNRSRKILERLLCSMRISAQVEARLVFVGADVCLYGLRPDDPVLLAHQLPKFFEDIRRRNGNFIQQSDVRFGKRLAACHVADNPYRKSPNYSNASVAVGIMCPHCRMRMSAENKKMLICPKCGFRERKKCGLKRSVSELDVLFPLEKQRVRQIYRWCDGVVSKRGIHRYLEDK